MKIVPDASEKIMSSKIELLTNFEAKVGFVKLAIGKADIWPWDLSLSSIIVSSFFCCSLNFWFISWLFTFGSGTTLTISCASLSSCELAP